MSRSCHRLELIHNNRERGIRGKLSHPWTSDQQMFLGVDAREMPQPRRYSGSFHEPLTPSRDAEPEPSTDAKVRRPRRMSLRRLGDRRRSSGTRAPSAREKNISAVGARGSCTCTRIAWCFRCFKCVIGTAKDSSLSRSTVSSVKLIRSAQNAPPC